MVSAKKTGIETENNILSIAERVLSRSKYELKTTIETIHDYEDRNLRMAVSTLVIAIGESLQYFTHCNMLE